MSFYSKITWGVSGLMQIFMRLAIAAQAFVMLFIGTMFVLRPVQIAAQFKLEPMSLLGHATLRADMFGFFASGAMFAIYAAVKGIRWPLLVPIVLLSCAIFGRLVSFGIDGVVPASVPPFATEIVMLTIVGCGYRTLRLR